MHAVQSCQTVQRPTQKSIGARSVGASALLFIFILHSAGLKSYKVTVQWYCTGCGTADELHYCSACSRRSLPRQARRTRACKLTICVLCWQTASRRERERETIGTLPRNVIAQQRKSASAPARAPVILYHLGAEKGAARREPRSTPPRPVRAHLIACCTRNCCPPTKHKDARAFSPPLPHLRHPARLPRWSHASLWTAALLESAGPCRSMCRLCTTDRADAPVHVYAASTVL